MDTALKEKKNRNTEYVVGLDMTDSFSQISVGTTDSEQVETLSTSADGSHLLIPTALFKRSEVNQWFAGKDAIKYKDGDGHFVDHLISKARTGEDIQVGDEFFKPSALLALFMKRALALVNSVTPLNSISCFMITVDVLDDVLIRVLNEAISSLGLKKGSVYFQSHMESFYNYILFQPHELWNREVFLFDSTGEYMKVLRLECNKHTTPIVAFVDTHEEQELTSDKYDSLDSSAVFASFASRTIDGHMYSSVYLIGDAFRNEWCKEGVNILCRKGRVFQGNNLFSKGAAYGARNKICPTAISTGHTFLGNDNIRSNVGIEATNRGENIYLPLLDGGTNWFDAKVELDIILNQGNKLTFLITPLTGKNPEMVDITLGELPKRPPRTTRLHLSLSMKSNSQMNVSIRDLGFGELYPSGNVEWNEVISI